MSQEPLTNRRGRPLMKEDLEDLHIDGEKLAPGESLSMAQPKREKRPRRPWKKWQKRTLVGVIIGVLVLPVAAGEMIRLHYEQSARVALVQVSDLTKNTVLPLQTKTNATSQNLSDITKRLNTIRDDTCSGGLLDNIAALYPRAKTALNACLTTRGKVAALVLATKETSEQLRYFEDISPLLAGVTAQTGDQYAVPSSQAENWKTFTDKLKTLSAPTSFKSSHDALVSHATTITSLWTVLDNASNAQDTVAFTDAEKKLGDEYIAVRALSSGFDKVILTSQQNASTAAKNLN